MKPEQPGLRIAGTVGGAVVAAVAARLAWVGLDGGRDFGTLSSPLGWLSLEAGITPLGAPFCALLAALGTAVVLWGARRGRALDTVLVATFCAAMLLVLCAQSVALFVLAWESMAFCSAFLVAAHHERRNVRRATFTYLLISQLGALCLIAALAMLAHHAGDPSFTAIARAARTLPPGVRNTVFALALVGFGSKAGLMPLHFWLPRAHPVAPPQASALMSGAMLKVALYGLLVTAFELCAPLPLWCGIVVIALGVVSAVLGVLYALVDHDLKRLLAYSSVENVGIIAIGIGVALVSGAAGLGALAGLALVAALFHAVNHGLFKGLLFLGAGMVADSEGTVDLERLGGLWPRLRWTAPAVLVGCMAIAALPPFNGFASEWLTFQSLVGGLRGAGSTVTVTMLGAIAGLALTGALAAACFVKVFGIVFLGRPRRNRPLPPPEGFDASTAALVLLAALCTVLGLVPALAVVPLISVAAGVLPAGSFGAAALAQVATLPSLPLMLAALPVAGAIGALALARRRGVRAVPTWTCGSPVTAASQYTATAFSKPLRTVFAFVLRPERRRRLEGGPSRWFPARIVYRTQSRYVVDEVARALAAAAMRFARRSRVVQGGSLRVYLAYAVVVLIVVVAVAR